MFCYKSYFSFVYAGDKYQIDVWSPPLSPPLPFFLLSELNLANEEKSVVHWVSVKIGWRYVAKFTSILFFFSISCNIWEGIIAIKVNFPGTVIRDCNIYGCLGKMEDNEEIAARSRVKALQNAQPESLSALTVRSSLQRLCWKLPRIYHPLLFHYDQWLLKRKHLTCLSIVMSIFTIRNSF